MQAINHLINHLDTHNMNKILIKEYRIQDAICNN